MACAPWREWLARVGATAPRDAATHPPRAADRAPEQDRLHRLELPRSRRRKRDAQPPAEPVLFFKATSSLAGPNDDVIIPKGASKLDWEVELALVIGRRARARRTRGAPPHTLPDSCCITTTPSAPFSWSAVVSGSKGKSADTFAPLGPWLVTPDEIAGSAASGDVVDGEWRSKAEEHHGEHDLRRLHAGELRQPVHDVAAG